MSSFDDDPLLDSFTDTHIDLRGYQRFYMSVSQLENSNSRFARFSQ